MSTKDASPTGGSPQGGYGSPTPEDEMPDSPATNFDSADLTDDLADLTSSQPRRWWSHSFHRRKIHRHRRFPKQTSDTPGTLKPRTDSLHHQPKPEWAAASACQMVPGW